MSDFESDIRAIKEGNLEGYFTAKEARSLAAEAVRAWRERNKLRASLMAARDAHRPWWRL